MQILVFAEITNMDLRILYMVRPLLLVEKINKTVIIFFKNVIDIHVSNASLI